MRRSVIPLFALFLVLLPAFSFGQSSTRMDAEFTAKQNTDSDLDDLSDGSLTGSKVGTGIPAANIADGTLGVGVVVTVPASAVGAAKLADECAASQVYKRNAGDTAWECAADATSAGGDPFPVGSVFMAVVATNPGTLLGYGTWSAFGAGKVLVGLDSGQTEFDTVEETGGAKTHTLTSSEMPSHTHTQDAHTHTQDSHNHTQDAHGHIYTSQTATTGGATSYEHGTLDTSSAEAEATETVNTTVATNQVATAVNQNTTAVNQSTGGGGAHNNLQPYIVVYMWKRTA